LKVINCSATECHQCNQTLGAHPPPPCFLVIFVFILGRVERQNDHNKQQPDERQEGSCFEIGGVANGGQSGARRTLWQLPVHLRIYTFTQFVQFGSHRDLKAIEQQSDPPSHV
jgi:hypothetical protein